MIQKLFLCGTGGSDVDEAVKRSLEKIMSDDLLSNFSYRGKRGKDPLINFNNIVISLKGKSSFNYERPEKELKDFRYFVSLYGIVFILDCVREFPSLTLALNTGRLDDKSLETAIASALKKASDRVFQRKK